MCWVLAEYDEALRWFGGEFAKIRKAANATTAIPIQTMVGTTGDRSGDRGAGAGVGSTRGAGAACDRAVSTRARSALATASSTSETMDDRPANPFLSCPDSLSVLMDDGTSTETNGTLLAGVRVARGGGLQCRQQAPLIEPVLAGPGSEACTFTDHEGHVG